jgi:hypothetical protein
LVTRRFSEIDEVALLLPEEDAMLDRRRHQQRDGHRRQQQRDEVDIALQVVDIAEARGERDGQQEREQHLHARKDDAQLLQ